MSEEPTTRNGPSVFVDEQVATQILSIVTNASKKVILVTPYLKLWGHLKRAIEDAISRNVEVDLVLRANPGNFDVDSIQWLLDNRVKIYKIDDLHAKIYVNDNTVLISSMNITEYSTKNSFEIAMNVRNVEDVKAVRNYVSYLKKKSTPILLDQEPSAVITTNENSSVAVIGKCIRCGNQIGFDPAHPLCEECYTIWAEYSNWDYPENYCHSCGNRWTVTYAKPLCSTCYG